MKNHKIITSEKEEIITQDIICNVCGEKINKNQFGYFDDYLSIEKRWGFSSDFDNETHCIDICQKCYKTFFNKLKINPECTSESEPPA